MEADGRSLDDKRTPVDENDIPDIIHRFKKSGTRTGKKQKQTNPSLLKRKKSLAMIMIYPSINTKRWNIYQSNTLQQRDYG